MGRYGSAWGRTDALWCAFTITRERCQQFLYGGHRTSVMRSSFSTVNLLVPLRDRKKEREGKGRMVKERDSVERSYDSVVYGSVNRETDRSNTKTAYFTSLKNRVRMRSARIHCETTKSVAPLNDSSRTEVLTTSVRAPHVTSRL